MSTPRILDIANDAHAAALGLQPWERDYLLTRCFPGRNGAYPTDILIHLQDGTTIGSLDWWVNGDGVQASSTVLINKDGTIVRCIPEEDGPWTNGDVQSPTPESAELRARGGNVNIWCLTIEVEGREWHALTEAQIVSLDWQISEWQHAYPQITDDHILTHYMINSVSRAHCARPLYEQYMAHRRTGKPTSPGGAFGKIVQFDSPKKVTIVSTANARRWGELSAEVMDIWQPGKVAWMGGYVIGDSVDGEDRWYFTSGPKAWRVWVGNTNRIGIPRT